MKRNLDDPGGYSNYTKYFYFLRNGTVSIDRIKITFNKFKHWPLKRVLDKRFTMLKHVPEMKDGKVVEDSWIDVYETSQGKKFRYTYTFIEDRWWNGIHFDDPNLQVQQEVDEVFKALKITVLESQIELPVDAFADDPVRLKDFVEETLFQKYQKVHSFFDHDTFYTTDIRTKSRGIREYNKRLPGGIATRVELQLNRSSIKVTPLSFPVKSITIDLNRYYDFRYIDHLAIEKYLIRKAMRDPKSRAAIDRMNRRRPGMGNIAIQQIRSYLSVTDYKPLLAQVEWLKSKTHGIKGYHRFFRKLKIDGEPILGVRTFAC